MAAQAFTKNHTDHSNDKGYQFEFFCDKCGNGFRSTYVANKAGMAASLLGMAGDMFGGAFAQAANAGNRMKDALRGKGWDDAFAAAIGEIKPKFKQCTRCGNWICPEVCWNPKASLCKACAPDLAEESAAAQADALRFQVASQMHSKAASADLVGAIDIKEQKQAVCPHCSARVGGGKFCPDCGKPLAQKSACGKCNAEIPVSSKFCPECGAPKA